MRYFAGKTPGIGIVVWLFLGNIVGFDKTPWPLLLVILNLPQLSIMISLQVSANRSQAASDRRAIADHETLIAVNKILTAVVKPALRSPTESLASLIVAIRQLPAMLDKRGDDYERAGSG